MKKGHILVQPYPTCESKARNWRVIISISLFVALFMLVFQPFGLASLPEKYKVPVLVGYGLVSFCVLFLNLMVIERLFNEEKWKVYKELLWTMWIIFSIGVANFFYTTSMFQVNISPLRFLLQLELSTFAIGVFPVTILVVLRFQRLNKSNTRSANELCSALARQKEPDSSTYKGERVTLKSENGRESLSIDPLSLKYIESKGNYIYVVYSENNELRKQMLRNTLVTVVDQLSDYTYMVRCHRSYIVNKGEINKVNGNAQGLKLELQGLERKIPVSRSYINTFR